MNNFNNHHELQFYQIGLPIHEGMDEMYEKFRNLLMLLWKTGCMGCL